MYGLSHSLSGYTSIVMYLSLSVFSFFYTFWTESKGYFSCLSHKYTTGKTNIFRPSSSSTPSPSSSSLLLLHGINVGSNNVHRSTTIILIISLFHVMSFTVWIRFSFIWKQGNNFIASLTPFFAHPTRPTVWPIVVGNHQQYWFVSYIHYRDCRNQQSGCPQAALLLQLQVLTSLKVCS